MTEFLVSQNNSGLPTNPPTNVSGGSGRAGADLSDWQKGYGLKPTPQEAPKEINLREALEWLLGSPDPDEQYSEEEKAIRRERRLDLLMWIMNLEVRLSAY